MIRRALTVLALALAALAAGGCLSPFQPATPQTPTGPGVVGNYSTPDHLLQTMANAIMDKSVSGRNAYNDALADSAALSTRAFFAFPDPAVPRQWTSPIDPWDIIYERRLYDYLIGVAQTFSYEFSWADDLNSPIKEETADNALYHRYYRLVARSPDRLVERTIAVGYADLSMQKYNGRWYLYRWNDRVDPSVGTLPADANSYSMGWRRFASSH